MPVLHQASECNIRQKQYKVLRAGVMHTNRDMHRMSGEHRAGRGVAWRGPQKLPGTIGAFGTKKWLGSGQIKEGKADADLVSQGKLKLQER